MIVSKDGKIVSSDKKIFTSNGNVTPGLITKVETALQQSEENKTEIDRIKSGETLVGSIMSVSVDGEEILPDDEGNINIQLPKYYGATKLSYNSNTGELLLKNQNDTVLSSVDLPLELLIKSGKYNPVVKQIELTMANGDKIEIPIDDLADFYQADEETLTLNEGTKTFSLATKWKEAIENKADSSLFQNYLTKKDAANSYVSRVALDAKQDKLINGTNIKSINGYSLLGAGNLNLDGAGGINPDGSTVTYNRGSSSDASWHRLAKIVNPSVNASGKFIIDYYDGESLINTTTFLISCAIDEKGEILSKITPLIKIPEKTEDDDVGLQSLRIEKSEEGMFVVGLVEYGIAKTDKKNQIINVTIQDNINFENVQGSLNAIYYQYDNDKIDLTDSVNISKPIEFNAEITYTNYASIMSSNTGTIYKIKNGTTGNVGEIVILGFNKRQPDEYVWTFCNKEIYNGFYEFISDVVEKTGVAHYCTNSELTYNINESKAGTGVLKLIVDKHSSSSYGQFEYYWNGTRIYNTGDKGIILTNDDSFYDLVNDGDVIKIFVKRNAPEYNITSDTPTSGDLGWELNNERCFISLTEGLNTFVVSYTQNHFVYILNDSTIDKPEDYGINLTNLNNIDWWEGRTEVIEITLTKRVSNKGFKISDNTSNLLEFINEKCIKNFSSYVKTTFNQLTGNINVLAGDSIIQIKGPELDVTVNKGESKTISDITLNKDNIYSITGISDGLVYFDYKLDSNAILNFKFDNTFGTITGTPNFSNDFPDVFKSLTYQYGIKADLVSYDLYDLNEKIEGIQNPDLSNYQPKLTAGEGITIDNNVISSTGGSSGAIKEYDSSLTFSQFNAEYNKDFYNKRALVYIKNPVNKVFYYFNSGSAGYFYDINKPQYYSFSGQYNGSTILSDLFSSINPTDLYQLKLTAGNGITINNNVISSTGDINKVNYVFKIIEGSRTLKNVYDIIDETTGGIVDERNVLLQTYGPFESLGVIAFTHVSGENIYKVTYIDLNTSKKHQNTVNITTTGFQDFIKDRNNVILDEEKTNYLELSDIGSIYLRDLIATILRKFGGYSKAIIVKITGVRSGIYLLYLDYTSNYIFYCKDLISDTMYQKYITNEEYYGSATLLDVIKDENISGISSKQDKLTAGEGITIDNNVISADLPFKELNLNGGGPSPQWWLYSIYEQMVNGNIEAFGHYISGTKHILASVMNKEDYIFSIEAYDWLDNTLYKVQTNGPINNMMEIPFTATTFQKTLTAGEGITIDNNVISATGGSDVSEELVIGIVENYLSTNYDNGDGGSY